MRKYFLTGLAILLPIALTAIIIIFVFNLLTEPFLWVGEPLFSKLGFNRISTPFFSNQEVQTFLIQCVILLFIFFIIVLTGLLTRWYFLKTFLKFWDKLLHNIPFVNSVYKATQDIIKTIFATESQSFKQVVFVSFPNEKTGSIGLVTRETLPSLEPGGEPLAAVFVPTTPNPTSGYLLLYKKKDITYLDMTVEDAFKYIISCGVIPSPLNELKESIEKINS